LKRNRHFEDPSSKDLKGLIKLTLNEVHVCLILIWSQDML